MTLFWENALKGPYLKSEITRLTHYVGESKERFAELIDAFRSGTYRHNQRASGVMSACVEAYPHLIEPYLTFFVESLSDAPVAQRRNVFRILQFVPLPEALHGKLVNLCFLYLHDASQPIAIQAYAITVLGRLAGLYPDLSGEIRIWAEDILPFASPALRYRIGVVLAELPAP